MATVAAGPARPTYVRVCPVCDTANPPERARCACGALLAGVDFTLVVPASTVEAVTDAPPVPPPAPTILCPRADCAQPNPATAQRCVYCNTPLHEEAPVVDARPLPRPLRDRYRVVDAFPATGSEADILLVADRKTGDKAVAKLYRRGLTPDVRLLAILAQAVGDTVVRVLDHGVSDGAAYELLEYVPGGTLETLLHAGPLPMSDIRRIVAQIADALRGIHGHHILHRDLKPDNVLVRTAQPLSLALTDFGIASFSTATQHFTSVARTTKYAAPEVLTGVLDAKSDWWSLGMIVLEAASGRHPFDGLSEQVMNHQLATRPIDVAGVYDDDLRLLCRGLLLRDPKRRFGEAEVARWLAGDATLTVGPDAESAASAMRPYRIGKSEANTAGELALALARNWDDARRDLARGQVARWIEQELHDQNLLRTLRDIQDRRDLTDDGRLLRFLVTAAPDLPPIWRGSPVSVDAIRAAARAGANGDAHAVDWLDSLVTNDVPASFAPAVPALRTLAAEWNEAWNHFAMAFARMRHAEAEAAKAPRDVGGGKAVSFDDLVYGHALRLELPPRREQNAPLLLALSDPAYLATLREHIVAAQGEIAGACPWFEEAWNEAGEDPARVVLAFAMLPAAREAAAVERRRDEAAAQARDRTRGEMEQQLRAVVSRILALSPKSDENLSEAAIESIGTELEGVQRACMAIAALPLTDPGYERLRVWSEKLAWSGGQVQRALARLEAARATNAIFITRQRLQWAGTALVICVMLRLVPVLIGLLVVATLWVAYRWYSGYHATELALGELRAFGLQARSFLRSTDPPAPGGDGDGAAGFDAPDGTGASRWWRRNK